MNTPDDPSGSAFAYRLGWGHDGLAALAPECDVIVVVDVLGFCSAVSAATEAGATVEPARSSEPATAPSPSPTELLRIEPGVRVVLDSPDGAALALDAVALDVPFVLAGCFRNATATARRAGLLAHGSTIGVVAAGERPHHPGGSWLPAVEDLLGAGAVLHALDPAGSVSAPRCDPDARAARAAFLDARPLLADVLAATTSGHGLIERGGGPDVVAAAALDVAAVAAQLIDGAFVAV